MLSSSRINCISGINCITMLRDTELQLPFKRHDKQARSVTRARAIAWKIEIPCTSCYEDFCITHIFAAELIEPMWSRIPFSRFNGSLYWVWQPGANIDSDILRQYRALESVILTEAASNEYPLTCASYERRMRRKVSRMRSLSLFTPLLLSPLLSERPRRGNSYVHNTRPT